MSISTYTQRRGQIEAYFDRTASDAWARLTSDAPVSRIRETVRMGRDRMRSILLSYLPGDLSGRRVLDAGCGTGALAIEAARRGAQVIAIDLSPTLINIARQRLPKDVGSGSIQLLSGDMLDDKLGSFHHVVAMDSLIHYRAEDVAAALIRLAPRIECSMIFTFAPKTLPLTVMHRLGKAFPRGDRSPAIEPLGEARLRSMVERADLNRFAVGRTERVSSGFYTSQAMELLVK